MAFAYANAYAMGAHLMIFKNMATHRQQKHSIQWCAWCICTNMRARIARAAKKTKRGKKIIIA